MSGAKLNPDGLLNGRYYPRPSGRVWYVDAFNGNDSNAGTANSPKQSIAGAFNAGSSGDTFVFYAGSYACADYFTGTSNNITTAYCYDHTVIAAEPGSVIWSGIEEFTDGNSGNDLSIRYYGLIFEGNTANVGSWHHLGGRDKIRTQRHFHNCLFRYLNGSISWGYTNASGPAAATTFMYNCTIYNETFNSAFSNGGGALINCAGSTSTCFDNVPGSHPSSSKDIIKRNNIQGVSMDINGNITSGAWEHAGDGYNPDGSKAHIGVYGGPFSWETSNDTKVMIEQNNRPAIKYIDYITETRERTYSYGSGGVVFPQLAVTANISDPTDVIELNSRMFVQSSDVNDEVGFGWYYRTTPGSGSWSVLYNKNYLSVIGDNFNGRTGYVMGQHNGGQYWFTSGLQADDISVMFNGAFFNSDKVEFAPGTLPNGNSGGTIYLNRFSSNSSSSLWDVLNSSFIKCTVYDGSYFPRYGD